jgi:hypothetical protein
LVKLVGAEQQETAADKLSCLVGIAGPKTSYDGRATSGAKIMPETSTETEHTKPWVKTVGKRRMLIPTLDLVKASVETADDSANVLELRQTLAEKFGTDSTCPVTIRHHLQALGIPVRKGTDRIKP